jgi:hypothetical protein
LGNDPDRDFILSGISNGFDIIDSGVCPVRVEVDNHPSASVNSPYFELADSQIKDEIVNGNYIPVKEPPLVVSPLGVIPKADGGVRIIHDCSRPQGSAVNDYATHSDRQVFQSVDDAASLLRKGYYMAKVDLKSAYRSVPLSPRSCEVTGIKWLVNGSYQYFYDSKLPFGAKLAPGIFHRLTQAVRRMMARRGIEVVAYLDDFFLCEPSFTKCAKSLRILIHLLRKLGFAINWRKVVDPTQTLTFLGIELDSATMELRLSADKLFALRNELTAFSGRKRANKKQLQSLIGKLNWAASVVRGGRVFLRRLIDAICGLRCDSHRVRLGADILADIQWWVSFLATFNGKSIILDERPISAVYTDACIQGGGGHWGHNWFYINWDVDWPAATPLHINEKEILSVVLAAHLWGPQWANKRVFVFSDNTTVMAGINKGTSRNGTVMLAIRYLFWHAAIHNYHLRVLHIPGRNNRRADAISRLHEPGFFWSAENPLVNPGLGCPPNQFITYNSLNYLCSRYPGPVGR